MQSLRLELDLSEEASVRFYRAVSGLTLMNRQKLKLDTEAASTFRQKYDR